MLYLIDRCFVRFVFVGLVNTIWGYSVYSILIFSEINYAWAILWANLAGIIFNYFSISKYVFLGSGQKVFFRFVGTYCFLYGVNTLGVWFLFNYVYMDYYLAGLVTLIPCALLSYSINKVFVFREES